MRYNQEILTVAPEFPKVTSLVLVGSIGAVPNVCSVAGVQVSRLGYEFQYKVILVVILLRTIFNTKLDMACHIFITKGP